MPLPGVVVEEVTGAFTELEVGLAVETGAGVVDGLTEEF